MDGLKEHPSQGWREFDHFYSNYIVFIRLARHLDTLSFVLLCFRTVIEQVLAIRCLQNIRMSPLRYCPHKTCPFFLMWGLCGRCFRMAHSFLGLLHFERDYQ
jgi:hypothetical protein